jgi:hypothetical protein
LGRQSQARSFQRVKKASVLLKLGAGSSREERLQCPFKAPFPNRGKRVGGVSGRPTRVAGRSDPFAPRESRRWKAPGLRKGVSLRGAALERRSRSVRLARFGLFQGGRSHRRQWVLFGRRGGERRQLAANKARALDASVKNRRPRDTSFTRSEGPCTSILTELRRRKSSGVRRSEVSSRSGKPAQAGRTGTGEASRWTERGSPRVNRSRKGGRVTRREKEGGCGLRPCEERELGFSGPVRRTSCRKSIGGVRPRIRSRAALQKEWRRE